LDFEVNEEKSFRFLTIPNLISIFRILLILPLALYVWHSNLKMIVILVLIAIISDFFDGIIARRFNQISEWGKILDPLADKLAIGTVLIVLFLKQQVPLWIVIIIVGRDVVIVLTGFFIAKKYRFIASSNFIGKVTANVLAVMVVSYIFNIDVLKKIMTLLAIFLVFLSSYSYLKRFIMINKAGEDSL
jgi:CDP-diacylglycerol--glycerol-3-phosphate 3-phosphatidyltransferase